MAELYSDITALLAMTSLSIYKLYTPVPTLQLGYAVIDGCHRKIVCVISSACRDQRFSVEGRGLMPFSIIVL